MTYNFSYRESGALFWPPQAIALKCTCAHIDTHAYTYFFKKGVVVGEMAH